MRRLPWPLSVTRPPPSSTMRGPLALRTIAVAAMSMVTGAVPQLNVMIPPAATALTTAAEVQLAAVPVPITRVGCEVSTGPASPGTDAPPPGLPGFPGLPAGRGGFGVVGIGLACGSTGSGLGLALGFGGADGVGCRVAGCCWAA